MRLSRLLPLLSAIAMFFSFAARPLAARTTVADALKLVPIQADVVYDRPNDKETAQCKLAAEKNGKVSGWIVRGAAGQLLRRFLDTNGDNKVDRWCYYRNGVEVYRDIDSDFDEKADQYRWLGTSGMRWGLDENEDGQIDRWKAISAEEVSAELIAAIRKGDRQRFQRLLVSGPELQSLGLSPAKQKQLAQKIQQAAAGFVKACRGQRTIGPHTKWVTFSATQPGVVPAGAADTARDLIVYDNAVAMFDNDGKPGQLSIGTLVQVGEAWRLIDLPQGLEQDESHAAASGFFFAAYDNSVPEVQTAAEDAASPELQKLVASLDRLEADIAMANQSGSATQLAALNDRRADTLQQLARLAKTDQERSVWVRQLADTISAAVQSGAYPKGTQKLAALYQGLEPKSELAGYVKFRQMSASYAVTLQDPDADFAKVQEQWLKQLEEFVGMFPKSPDAAEAMLQLAIAQEFAGREDEARKWYQQIVTAAGDSLLSKKAQGALRRLDSMGKPIPLRGRLTNGRAFDLTSLVGRVVLVHYWATWCEPCKQDLQVLRELQTRYGKRGFSLVGVNLDSNPKVLAAFLRQTPLPWPQVQEAGGLDGRLAVEMGVLTLPTMVLIDQKGNVLNRSINVTELEGELRKRLR